MFDIGFAELLIVAVVALVVLGPEKLPTAARTAGLWIGHIRRTLSGIQNEINAELRLDESKHDQGNKTFESAELGDLDFSNDVVTLDELRAQKQKAGSADVDLNDTAPPEGEDLKGVSNHG